MSTGSITKAARTVDVDTPLVRGTGESKDRRKSAVVISDRRKKLFLDILARTGKVAHSARMAGYSDSSHVQRCKRNDPEFAEAWELAIEASMDTLEDEAIRRARDGVDKPVFYKGRVVGHEKQYSDQLTMFLLKGNRPDRYNRSNVDISGHITGKFGVAVLPMAVPTMADWERASQELHKDKQESAEDPEGNIIDGDVKRV